MEKAHNGAEGLPRYAAAPADRVITAMRMPGLEGRPLRLALRARFPPANLLAGSGEPGLLARARASHVPGTLRKPWAAAALLEAGQQRRGPREAAAAPGVRRPPRKG